MKVIEIIKKEPINEASVLPSLFGGAVGLLAKALGKSDKKLAIEALTKFFDKNTGKIVSRTQEELNAINAAKQQYGDKIIKSAESLAMKNAKEAKFAADTALLSSKWQSIKDSISKTYSYGKWIASAATSLWWCEVIIEPYKVYMDEIQRGEEAVENNVPNWTPEYFEQYRKQRTSILIGKVAGQLMAQKLLTFKLIRVIPGVSTILKNKVLTNAAEAFLMDYINGPEGSKYVSTIMLAHGIPDVIGGLGTTAIDALTNKVNDATTKVVGTTDTAAKPDTTPTTAVTPDTMAKPVAPSDAEPSRWSSSLSPASGDIYTP